MDSATRESQALDSASVKQGGQAASVTLSQVCWRSSQPLAALGYRGPYGGSASEVGILVTAENMIVWVLPLYLWVWLFPLHLWVLPLHLWVLPLHLETVV